jgi:hypothetical protein
MKMPFIGRVNEIQMLKDLQSRNISNLVIIRGRRRIGKSRLAQEFGKDQKFISISGIAPNKETTAQQQRDEFARQLAQQLNLPKFSMDDWADLFTMLAKQTATNKVIILFDEISWMGSLDPQFLGKLKNAWDLEFKQNAQLMLLLCGSVSPWIDKNIINSTLFLGRPSLYIDLKQLTLPECNQFFGINGERICAYEKLKILSITGGIPRYLEFIDPKVSAEENIRMMCFTPHSPLVDEFERIFSDIFGERSHIYRKIITALTTGPATQEKILQSLGRRSKSGDISEYLKDLEIAGFISRDYTWNLKDGKPSKLSLYRLIDNYVRFYLKYIVPNKAKIMKGTFNQISISNLPAWESILGLQFENLVLNNEKQIAKILKIPLEEIVFCNPFFQKQTKNNPGCQIDFMIQTKFNCLYIIEIKFSKHPLTSAIIHEVKEKMQRLKTPKNFSYRPVLIHVNDVRDEVIDSGFFSHIIDFGEILNN